jgi:hypothetical protein
MVRRLVVVNFFALFALTLRPDCVNAAVATEIATVEQQLFYKGFDGTTVRENPFFVGFGERQLASSGVGTKANLSPGLLKTDSLLTVFNEYVDFAGASSRLTYILDFEADQTFSATFNLAVDRLLLSRAFVALGQDKLLSAQSRFSLSIFERDARGGTANASGVEVTEHIMHLRGVSEFTQQRRVQTFHPVFGWSFDNDQRPVRQVVALNSGNYDYFSTDNFSFFSNVKFGKKYTIVMNLLSAASAEDLNGGILTGLSAGALLDRSLYWNGLSDTRDEFGNLLDVELKTVSGLDLFHSHPDSPLQVNPIANATVPEPGNWVLLIIGYGLTGAFLRFRKTLAA